MAVESVQSVVEKSWGPNKGKQALYLSLPDSIFEQFYGGAAGGGKTEALLMRPILRQWTDNPRFQGLIIRRTYKELEESVIERSKRGGTNTDGTQIPSFYELGATYNEQKKRWRWPSGATISFGHAEEEKDVRKYDTAEFQYIGFDELTSFTEFQYRFLAFSRCRSVIPEIPALVCSASNPGNVGHRWVRERFVEPAPEGGTIINERIGDQVIKRIFIQAFLTDNPRLMESDPLYKVRLEMLPEAERRAKLLGDWWTFSGQVFAEWRELPWPGEPENACHVVKPFIPNPELPRVLAIDWGFQAMTFALWAVPLPHRRGLIYREFTPNPTKDNRRLLGIKDDVVDEKTVQAWTTRIANICLMHEENPYIVLDPSAWQNRGVKTVQEQFLDTWREVTGHSPLLEKADNDRSGGKMLIHDYLRWKSRPKWNPEITESYDASYASWIYRNKGEDAHSAYLRQFSPPEEEMPEHLPRLHVTSDCRILIKTIPLCVYDETQTKKSSIEEVKEFLGDDPYDTLRYLLKKLDTVRVEDGISERSEEEQNAAEVDWNKIFSKARSKQITSTPTYIPMGRMSRRRFRR